MSENNFELMCPCCNQVLIVDPEKMNATCMGQGTIMVPPPLKDAFEQWLEEQEKIRLKDRENFKKQFGKLPIGTTDPEDEALDQERESC